jgi:hypothetical protein
MQVSPVEQSKCRELFQPFGSEVTQRMMCVTGGCWKSINITQVRVTCVIGGCWMSINEFFFLASIIYPNWIHAPSSFGPKFEE